MIILVRSSKIGFYKQIPEYIYIYIYNIFIAIFLLSYTSHFNTQKQIKYHFSVTLSLATMGIKIFKTVIISSYIYKVLKIPIIYFYFMDYHNTF